VNQREAKWVAYAVASAVLTNAVDGRVFANDARSADDREQPEKACRELADELYWKGAKDDVPIMGVLDAMRAARVTPSPRAVP